jgi:hypothetical protein
VLGWCRVVAMSLPFTIDQFFDVFRRYNEAVWPWQVALFALGLGTAVLALARPDKTARLVSGALAFLWTWMAVEYHWRFFASISPAARFFALVFLLEAAAIAWFGVIRRQLVFGPASRSRRTLAAILFAYALVAYPYLGFLAGHRYPATPTFGVPCPTTILTLGLLSLARPGLSRVVLVVPLLWSALGGYAAFRLGVPQDLGLLAAGIVTVPFVQWTANRHSPGPPVGTRRPTRSDGAQPPSRRLSSRSTK